VILQVIPVRGSRDCLCFSKGSLCVVVERTRNLPVFFQGISARGSRANVEQLPSTGGLCLRLHKPIKFQTPLKVERTPHGPCATLIYVDMGGNQWRSVCICGPLRLGTMMS
jgi:hypothetical protein